MLTQRQICVQCPHEQQPNYEGCVNAWVKSAAEKLAITSPQMYRLCYPKRIIPPTAYANPKYYGVQTWAHLRMLEAKEMRQLPHVTCQATGILLASNRMPTYFVAPEFALAVAKTKPPEGFKLSDILWPLPAMLLVLHEAFSREYFGWNIPFIGVARVPAGVYPVCAGWPFTPAAWFENLDLTPALVNGFTNSVDRIAIHATWMPADDPPTDYTANYPLHYGMEVIEKAELVDATDFEHMLYMSTTGEQVSYVNQAPTPEQDLEITHKVANFAIRLLLALTARPGMIQNAGIARPQRVKKNRIVQNELWHPSIIGEHYRISRPSRDQGGTHASPRLHWRIGHYTHQAIGKRTETRVRISDLPVNDEGKPDWSKVEESVRQAFWAGHRLSWIEPILVNVPSP